MDDMLTNLRANRLRIIASLAFCAAAPVLGTRLVKAVWNYQTLSCENWSCSSASGVNAWVGYSSAHIFTTATAGSCPSGASLAVEVVKSAPYGCSGSHFVRTWAGTADSSYLIAVSDVDWADEGSQYRTCDGYEVVTDTPTIC